MTDAGEPKLSTSRVVTEVFDQILVAIHEGTLLPGERISDAVLAEQFGVSRTPVREALQRLREIGIIEASANRFTRVADVTPEQTAQAYVVWLALYRALVEEVIPRTTSATHQALKADHAAFLESLTERAPQRIATANFQFFSHLPLESGNPALQRAIVSVVHIVRLGSLSLPDYIDLAAVGRAQALLVDAARTRQIAPARDAMKVLATVVVPQE